MEKLVMNKRLMEWENKDHQVHWIQLMLDFLANFNSQQTEIRTDQPRWDFMQLFGCILKSYAE